MKLIDNILDIGRKVGQAFSFETRSGNWGSPVSILDANFGNKIGLFSGNTTIQKGESLIPVFACVNVIAESISSMPFDLVGIDDTRQSLTNHRLHWLVTKQPSEFQSKTIFWEVFLRNALLSGNGYAEIIRDNAYRPKGLRLWMWNEVGLEVRMQRDYEEVVYLTPYGKVDKWDMIHLKLNSVDGLRGRSHIEVARNAIGEGIAAQEHGKNFYENGAKLTGFLKTPNRLDELAKNNLKESFEGARNSGRMPILEQGLEFQSVQMPFGDAQFLETRQFGFDLICTLFKVPPALVSNYKDAKYANSEQMDLGYVKHTLTPIVNALEEEISLKLLSESDWKRATVNINMEGLLRGDLASLTDHVEKLVNNGTYHWNDGLKVLGKPISDDPNANKRWVHSGMMPADVAAAYYMNGKLVGDSKLPSAE